MLGGGASQDVEQTWGQIATEAVNLGTRQVLALTVHHRDCVRSADRSLRKQVVRAESEVYQELRWEKERVGGLREAFAGDKRPTNRRCQQP